MTADPKDPSTWPEFWAGRPVDLKTGLPIPAISMKPDGGHDFTTVNSNLSLEFGQNRVCGICSKTMGWWVTFVGGTLSIASHQFTTPPMHPECAEAAMTMCPHIRLQKMKRATDKHASGVIPPLASPDKPDKWFMGKCRSYEMYKVPTKDGGYGIAFLAGKFKEIRTFVYVDGLITEVPSELR